ncbi:MAG TPA: peptidoglycan DD-metalloendopeptidase family protein [Spirochaetia bacterium]|nr:peptidoglycan DD-metalloendopeptidase family protein [Spirochaetia bacterium]
MKALPTLLCFVAAAIAPIAPIAAQPVPVLSPPDGIRRGEPGIATLALPALGGPAGAYELSVRYADGTDGPIYRGFAAPRLGPGIAALGRDIPTEGPSAAPVSGAVVLFLLSAPIAAPLGEASMVARAPDGEAVAGARFYIGDREFGRQDLRLDQALTSIRIDPDPVKTEQAIRYQALLSSVDPTAAFLDSGFSMPVASERRTTLFGMRRRYIYADGGVEASTHSGVDYGCPTGSPVVAPGRGRVVMIEDRIVTGKTVILEHLPGTYSIYMHLDRFDPGLTLGAVVPRGAPLGAVGMTGLATGPHLHWELRVMGQACDPEALVGLDKVPWIRTIVPAIEGR